MREALELKLRSWACVACDRESWQLDERLQYFDPNVTSHFQ